MLLTLYRLAGRACSFEGGINVISAVRAKCVTSTTVGPRMAELWLRGLFSGITDVLPGTGTGSCTEPARSSLACAELDDLTRDQASLSAYQTRCVP